MEDQGTFDLGDDLGAGIPAEELSALADGALLDRFWPRRFIELIDVAEATLARETGLNNARALAEKIVLEVSRYCGSKPMYLPFPGRKLQSLMRARRVYRDQGHVSPEDLSSREGVCVQQIYRDIATMTEIERTKRQPGLFGGAAIRTLGVEKFLSLSNA